MRNMSFSILLLAAVCFVSSSAPSYAGCEMSFEMWKSSGVLSERSFSVALEEYNIEPTELSLVEERSEATLHVPLIRVRATTLQGESIELFARATSHQRVLVKSVPQGLGTGSVGRTELLLRSGAQLEALVDWMDRRPTIVVARPREL
jgi:hypothetical protein